jgi:hypothetical protein
MKLKILALALFAAGACASLAFAEGGTPPVGSTSSTTSSDATTTNREGDHGHSDCTRLVVGGTVASLSGTTVTVNVLRSNDPTAVGKPATFTVGPRTHVSWEGVGSLAGPSQGDRVGVFQWTCGSNPPVVAAVGFRPASRGDSQSHD